MENGAIRWTGKWALPLLALGAVLSSSRAEAEEKLVFMSWGGTWATYAQKAFVEPFEKETGIKVEVRAHQNTMDGLAKLQAVRDNLDVDVWATSPVPAAVALSQGVVAKFDPSKVANAANLPKELITPACIAWYRFFFGIVYNDQKVPFPITQWKDLLDPRLKGEIAVPNASNGEGKFLLQLAWLSGGSENNIEPGFEMAKRLRPNAGIYYNSYTERDKALAAGEVSVGGMSLVGEYLDLAKGNPQFKFVAAKPFVPADFDCFSIVNGKNQANAYKFVNFALSKAAQESFASQALVLPAAKEAAVPAALAPYAPADLVYHYPDSAIVKDKLQNWIDRWNQEVQAP